MRRVSIVPHLLIFSFCLMLNGIPTLLSFSPPLVPLFSPITEAYKSAYAFASQGDFARHAVTRAEYAESGSSASRRKFRDWKPQEAEKEKPPKEVVSSKAKGKQPQQQQQREPDDRPQAPSKLSRTRSTRVAAGAASASTRKR
jgi:actin-related protein 6